MRSSKQLAEFLRKAAEMRQGVVLSIPSTARLAEYVAALEARARRAPKEGAR